VKNWLHYRLCGLDNVWLASGYQIKDTKYGRAVSVSDTEGLHRLLTLALIKKAGLLSGKEFRFLRVQLGLSQQGLGRFLGGLSENAVSLWERKNTVPAIYDHWLRLMMIAKFSGDTKVADAVERIHTVEKLIHQDYVVKGLDAKRRVEVVKDAERELMAE
jgi:DNA-binding transcriptional regulator YiaG